MSNCNVQCAKSHIHTYQQPIGKLSIYNANTDPLGQAQGIVLDPAHSATFSIPKMSVLLGWYICNFNPAAIIDPSLNFSFKPLDTLATLPIFSQYITNYNFLNVLENEINYDKSIHGDDYATIPRIMERMNQLGFFTCDFAKMISQVSNFMDNNTDRNLTIENADPVQGYIVAPVYIDLSWIYGTNS